jgi:hypothetical protein
MAALGPNGELYYAAYNDTASLTGIYELSITGGTATNLVKSGASVVFPNELALDLPDGLIFFTDDDFTGGTADNIDVLNISTGKVSVLKTFTPSVSNYVFGIAVDPATKTLYYTTLGGTGPASSNAIFSATFSVSGGTVSINPSTTLYSNLSTVEPGAITIDPANGVFYVGSQYSPSNGVQNIYEGSLTGGGTLATVYTLGRTGAGPDTVINGGDLFLLSTPTVATSGTVTLDHVLSVVADSGATLTNWDGQGLRTATITIANYSSGDTLTATAMSGISASFSGGVLTLTGTQAALSTWQSELDSVAFGTSSPTHNVRTLNWSVSDGINTSATTTSAVNVICFCAGTMIGTPDGEVPVQTLQPGDMVLTAGNGPRAVKWVGQGKVIATRGRRSAATPVIVCKGALADNVPNRDLHVTKAHSLYIDDVLIPVEFLVNHRTILWDDRAREVEIYHIELDSHDVLLANRAPAESYRDDGNRWLFQNANSGWAGAPQEPCAPVLTGGPVVDAVWRRLLDRSGPRRLPPMTDDPDLHLLVDGVRVGAHHRDGSAYLFRLYHRPDRVIMASRSAVPAELGFARDSRPLGVGLRRITIRQGSRLSCLDAADDRLDAGFHGYEPAERLRWTDGSAELPPALFAGFATGAEVMLQLDGTMRYLDEAEEQAAA